MRYMRYVLLCLVMLGTLQGWYTEPAYDAHLCIDTILIGIDEGSQRAHRHSRRCASSWLKAFRRWLGGHHRDTRCL